MAQALFPAAAYLLCSGISLGLATSVFQPARRHAEVRVLHLTLTTLGCWYLILTIAEISPEGRWMFLDHLKAIAGTLLIASGVALLAATIRRFSANSLEHRIEMVVIRAVVIAVVAINVAAIYDGKYYAGAMRAVRIGYWLFAALFLFLGSRIIHRLHRRLPAGKRSRFGRLVFGAPIEAPPITSREWWAYLTLIGGRRSAFSSIARSTRDRRR